MALTVRLGPKAERALTRAARQRGISRSDVVREALARYASEETPPAGGGPFDQWADVIGLVSLGVRDPARTTGEQFAEALTRAGRASRPVRRRSRAR